MPYYIPLRFGAAWLALPADCVTQILGQLRFTRLPSAPAGFPGVAAFRGRAMAVLDLGTLLSESPLTAESLRSRAIIAEVKGNHVAIPVDEVQEAVAAEPADVKPNHISGLKPSVGELLIKDQVVPILDLLRLVDDTLASVAK